jgi:hypothetical protein
VGDVDDGHSGESAEHIDRTQYALPYPDTTFPSSKDTPCTTRYQIVLLNRQIPEQEDGYMCAASSAKLKSDLAGLTKGAEIALVGTTLNNNTDGGLVPPPSGALTTLPTPRKGNPKATRRLEFREPMRAAPTKATTCRPTWVKREVEQNLFRRLSRRWIRDNIGERSAVHRKKSPSCS